MQISDHYDGKRFFNLSDRHAKGLWDVLRWMVSRARQPWPVPCFYLGLTLCMAVSRPAFAEITVTLRPETVHAFDEYAQSVEDQLDTRWKGNRPFLSVDESPEERNKVLKGAVYIRPGGPGNPIGIQHGLIHDWVGTIFIPDTTAQKVVDVLQDFNNHSKIYADIVQSRLISRSDGEVSGEWRLRRTSPFLTLVLDVPEQEFYRKLSPGKWICRAYAKNISEIQNAGAKDEKKLPPGRDQGFLWRLYGYWSLQEMDGGVLTECRTLSLTRDVPSALAWIAKPFLQSIPRESLAATLKSTRAAAVK